ncbi:uncharacterized protein LOC142589973 isoform X5 [Dermacentor variabilis]|uniref:uncharacterized protein LOC142589973 isoform X5 n=1 Tax=Dermacentor variabilis TaxID=34621 RepID=UPI003F5C3181
MGRPRIVRSPEEQLAYERQRREQERARSRRRRAHASAEDRARDAARKRQCRADPAARAAELAREAELKRQRYAADAAAERYRQRRRRAKDPAFRAREAEQRRRRRQRGGTVHPGQTLGEALPAADGVKARRARVHRTTERRWSLVTCPHHSTSAAGTLRVATADFSAVFPDIDFKQAVEAACDKAPFIEASLASSTCRVEPWRGLQDKCVGEHEALLQHAEQSCQTEHHITLVRCTKPQVSTCSVEVQADPWWQHHCGIQPIGVDLCET